MIRRLIILLLIIGCVSGDNNEIKVFGLNDPFELSIININIWSGLNYEGIIKMGEVESISVYEQRYKTLITQLKQLDADIITMQEVNPLPTKAKKIAQDLDMDYIYHISKAGVKIGAFGLPTNLRHGDAIFAKKELNLEWVGRKRTTGGFVGNVFSFHFGDGSQVLAGKINVNNQPIHVFTTHWHASVPNLDQYHQLALEFGKQFQFGQNSIQEVQNSLSEEAEWRFVEAQGTIDYIYSICGDSLPYILAGDFNSTTEMPELHILNSLNMKDVFAELNPTKPGITWDAENNSNVHMQYPFKEKEEISTIHEFLDNRFNLESCRIDYIFYHPGDTKLKATHSQIVLNIPTDNVFPSDHYGVSAKFSIPYKDRRQ
jgi:endonuclease/exonuclease/phosphatase family metal-dependent hydrolase